MSPLEIDAARNHLGSEASNLSSDFDPADVQSRNNIVAAKQNISYTDEMKSASPAPKKSWGSLHQSVASLIEESVHEPSERISSSELATRILNLVSRHTALVSPEADTTTIATFRGLAFPPPRTQSYGDYVRGRADGHPEQYLEATYGEYLRQGLLYSDDLRAVNFSLYDSLRAKARRLGINPNQYLRQLKIVTKVDLEIVPEGREEEIRFLRYYRKTLDATRRIQRAAETLGNRSQ